MSTDDRLWARWDEVDALLDRALDEPAEGRREFVHEQCGDDTELAELVVRLLDVGATADSELTPSEGVVRDAFSDARTAPVQALIGSRAGAYRLVELIGRGGMGLVFRGERADGAFEREVAVKVFNRDPAVEWMADRFALERQILATLNHPAIAQMLDGGITDEGRPFLVMELVDGVPIDRFARERRLGIDDRVRLVLEVGEAVGHAHRHLVVHRDLKPSNILVTEDGTVKLLDFGIAKLLSAAPQADAEPVTRADRRFVTPEYAAPEQLLGEPVSTVTDVYALGALLYELLTGIRPYERREGQSVLERMIRGDEPTAPSAAVLDPGAGGGSGAGRDRPRGESGRRGESSEGAPSGSGVESIADVDLSRRLAGDLDAILLRALQSRPEARYPSVEALLDDLDNYLQGRAVSARGDARWYRARRFARQHRAPLSAAAGVFLLLAGSAAGLAVQRAAVVAERDRAEAAAERAQLESRTSREVTAFLIDLFEASDPEALRNDTLTVGSLLERGAARLDSDLAEQPLVRSELMLALSDAHQRVGQTDQALSLAERAVAIRRDSLEASDSVVAAALLVLGDRELGARFWSRAVETFGAVLRRLSEPPEVSLAAEAHGGLGTAYMNLEALDSAEVHLARAIELQSQLGWSSSGALNNLAGILRRRGDLEGAAAQYRRVVEEARESGSIRANAFAIQLNNLAVTLRMSEDYAGAADAYREAFDSLAVIYGPAHPNALMVSGNLARAEEERGRIDEALDIYSQRVSAAKAEWPGGHWRVAQALMSHGAALVKYGRDEDAIPILDEALGMGIEQLGAFHIWNAAYRGWLGTAAKLTARDEAADQLFGWSLEGVSAYDRFDTDAQALAMIRGLVEVMEARGLEVEAGRYRALLDLGS